MTKQEFLRRFEDEKLNIDEYIMVLDKITDDYFVIGCALDDGCWKIYKTRERGGHYIINEFDNEDSAFEFFYEFILDTFCKRRID